MAPQSRKRKNPSQSTTLHNFFSPDAVAAKKGKTLAPTPQTKGAEIRAAPRPSDEIIVIDSDSDGHIPVSKNGKKSDSIRVVDAPATAGPSNHKLKDGRVAGPSFGTLTGNAVAETSMSAFDHEDMPSFGKPSSLLRASTSSVIPDISFSDPSDLPHWASSPSASSSFGGPVHLLRDAYEVRPSKSHDDTSMDASSHFKTADDAGPSQLSIYSIQGAASSSNFADSSVKGLDEEDEWAMGDDEMALVDPEPDDNDEEDMEEIEIESSPPGALSSLQEVSEGITTCPICALHLVGLFVTEVQEHINKCIDSLSTSTSSYAPQHHPQPSTLSSSKPLLPLSSIQTLHGRNKSILTDIVKSSVKSDDDGSNAFSVLMSSHKENEAWKEAAIVEDRSFRPNKRNEGRRKAPFYKVLQGMPIAVDAFRYGSIPDVTAYFLTHAHSDHYTNLASNWKSGPIYCSQGTANLIIHMLAVDPKWVHPLPMDIPSEIPNTGGVRVTLIEANHCPGSCLFFFEGPQTVNAGDSVFKSSFVGSTRTFRYLHCGDFRASPKHVLHPAVKGKRIDHIYLDTTYLDPKYTFPPQPLVISACAELAKRIVSGQSTTEDVDGNTRTVDSFMTVQDKSSEKKKYGKILIVVGTYSIGKERIVKAIAQALNTRVYCDARKAAILRCQSDPELHALLTTDPLSAGVHLVPLSVITSDKLKTYMDRLKGNYTRAIGFRPTGWTYTPPAGSDSSPSIPSILSRAASRPSFTYASLRPTRNSTAALTLYGVPYSEHSSFFELTCFAMSLDWGKMIATVNVGSAISRGKMGRWVEKWEAEKKKRGKTEVVKHRESDYW